MAYEKQTWENGEFDEFDTLLNPETAKITADKMNHIEDGIGTLGDAVDMAQEQLSQIAESMPTEDLEQLKSEVTSLSETVTAMSETVTTTQEQLSQAESDIADLTTGVANSSGLAVSLATLYPDTDTINLNNLTTPGLYYGGTTKSYSNAPTGFTSGWIWVYASTGGFVYQIVRSAVADQSMYIYQRLYRNYWYSWYQFTPAEDLEQLKETVASMQETINSLVTGKYDGATTVTPTSTEQTLSTANTWLDEDVTVEGIPYSVEPNDTGDTVIIGDD